MLTLDGFGEQPQAMCWNFEGSLVAATCKDKVVRLFDPRADGLVAEAPSHQGLKVAFFVLCVCVCVCVCVGGWVVPTRFWLRCRRSRAFSSNMTCNRNRNSTRTDLATDCDGQATRVTWMGDSAFFVTSGFSKMRKRELWVWDATAMDAPVKKVGPSEACEEGWLGVARAGGGASPACASVSPLFASRGQRGSGLGIMAER